MLKQDSYRTYKKSILMSNAPEVVWSSNGTDF